MEEIAMYYKKNKYGNHSFDNAEGHWDSKNEYLRWCFLQDAEKKGLICNLRRQVKYELLPKQTGTRIRHLKTKDRVEEYTIELPVTYLADFVYQKQIPVLDCSLPHASKVGLWQTVVEDFKGERTDKYIIKRKMMLYFYGIEIREVKRPGEPI